MKLYKFLPLLVVLFLFSCSAVNVTTDYDREVDFAKYKSYSFLKDNKDQTQLSDLDKKRVFSAIDEQMTLKGYVKSDNPDILINILTDSKEIQNIENRSNMDNYFYYRSGLVRPWGWVPASYNQTITTTTEGILYIDIIDAESKNLVWQGKGTGYLSDSIDSNEKNKKAKMFISKILKTFPSR